MSCGALHKVDSVDSAGRADLVSFDDVRHTLIRNFTTATANNPVFSFFTRD